MKKNLYSYYKKVLYSNRLKGINTMKIKLTFWVISTYILLTGCGYNEQEECYANHHLEIDAPSLSKTGDPNPTGTFLHTNSTIPPRESPCLRTSLILLIIVVAV